MSLVGSLPLSHPKEGGQLYLANIGIPKNVYKEVTATFLSSFTLHPGWDQVRLTFRGQVRDPPAPGLLEASRPE